MFTLALVALFVCVFVSANSGRQGPHSGFLKGLFCGIAASAVLISIL